MPETVIQSSSGVAKVQLIRDIRSACGRIPPLWDLNNFVAVNPFLGCSSQPVAEVARYMSETRQARVLPGIDYYRKRWNGGAFQKEDLIRSAQRWQVSQQALEPVLTEQVPMPTRRIQPVRTFAERFDQLMDTSWQTELTFWAARWCSVHASQGASHWHYSCHDQGLYSSWHEASQNNHALEILGLKGFRSWIRTIPTEPLDAIAWLLRRVSVSLLDQERYFYRLLTSLYGWACYYRRQTWQEGSNDPGTLLDLLAINLCLDAAVDVLASRPVRALPLARERWIEDEDLRLIYQDALEDGFVRGLIGKLRPAGEVSPVRPALQAVFCIDVRSEPLRRHLEAESPDIRTSGFAGFFGVAVDLRQSPHGNARCPVLLQPTVPVETVGAKKSTLRSRLTARMPIAPAAAFSFVELLGLTYVYQLASDALGGGKPSGNSENRDPLVFFEDTLASRVALTRGILKNLGLQRSFARLVLLCGHEGQCRNNPHAAGFHCGACGGHGGGVNARVAASLFNDPAVRNELAKDGPVIPADTHFLPAVHDTTTDQVTLLDRSAVPETHQPDILQLETWLNQACQRVRLERAPTLGLSRVKPGLLDRILQRRAREVSEVRPEWGLARNAAFLAARRCRSREVSLQGRVFLHDYDAALDTDNSVLTLILSAPVVVASWINLQYLASTVDNACFGSGDKTIHNRVGSLGVIQGNGGDLQTGLSRQSIQGPDGEWYHDPLRLQVIVEASRERIDAVLARIPQVLELVENGWIRLFSLDRESSATFLRIAGPNWEPVDGKTSPGQED